MTSDILEYSCKVLHDHNLTIAFAESATAGRLCAAYALHASSGKVLRGGIVCYDAALKEHILHIPPGLIKKYTPESSEVTEQLCRKLKRMLEADVYIAVTGLTTPGGSETKEKPVGTMFIHLVCGDKSLGVREVYRGSPDEIISSTIERVAKMIIDLTNDIK